MGKWKEVKIRDILARVKNPITLQDEEEYQLVTIRMHHSGVVPRTKKRGNEIGSMMYEVRKGQFILSGIDARNGAFGIIPDELDKSIVTNDFWCFDIDETAIKRDFFYWLTNTPLFLDACIKSSEGTTNRRRLQKNKFFNFSLSIPSLEFQESFLQKLRKFEEHFYSLKHEIDHQLSLLKQLRQSVLQEAVEGKLTADWRKDHPELISGENSAEGLLEKIKNEKEKLASEGKISRQKPFPPVTDDEMPFDLPDEWSWVRLGEVAEVITSGSRDWAKYYSESGCAKFVRMGNLSKCSYRLRSNEIKYVNPPENGEGTRTSLIENDILISITGDVGLLGLVPSEFGEAYINQHIALLRLIILVRGRFYPTVLLSPYSVKQFLYPQRGIKNSFRLSDVSNHLVPLPPLPEQKIIVQRVEKILSMIDELELQVKERKEYAEQLMQSVLREAFDHDGE